MKLTLDKESLEHLVDATKESESLVFGNSEDCDYKEARDVVVTYKRPWWAFWRKDKVVHMPNAKVRLGDISIIDDEMSQEVVITPEVDK